VKTADPTLDNDGNALVTGALYFNSGAVTPADKGMRVYDGAVWIPASAAQEAALVTYEFVATAGQTTFSGADANGLALTYIAGGVIVSLNGVVLRPGDDFTATNGSSIVLASAASLNDEVVAYAFNSFDIANTYTQAQIDAGLALKANQATTYTKTETDNGFVAKTAATGSAAVPTGSTAQRDGSPAAGYFRFNSTLGKFEGFNGTAWGAVGGGATGGGSDDIFVENGQTVTTNYTITTNKNAMSAGPITVNSGVTVTVPSGSVWTIV
jgi:hypothetical protein